MRETTLQVRDQELYSSYVVDDDSDSNKPRWSKLLDDRWRFIIDFGNLECMIRGPQTEGNVLKDTNKFIRGLHLTKPKVITIK